MPAFSALEGQRTIAPGKGRSCEKIEAWQRTEQRSRARQQADSLNSAPVRFVERNAKSLRALDEG
jgi:hypothetical protein